MATDLRIPTRYGAWTITRSYRSAIDRDGLVGKDWHCNQADLQLLVEEDAGQIVAQHLYASAASRRTFVKSGSDYTAPKDSFCTLAHESDELVLREPMRKRVWAFNDGSANPSLKGRLLYAGHLDEGGSSSYEYNGSNELSSITLPDAVHTVDFSYNSQDLISVVSVKYDSTEVMKVEYDYRADFPSAANADIGVDDEHLVQVTVSEKTSASGQWTKRTTQYRYTNATNGVLKAVFEPDAVERAVNGIAGATTPDDLMDENDTTMNEYASRRFEYYSGPEDTSDVITVWAPTGEDFHDKYGGGSMNATNVTEDGKMVRREIVSAGAAGCCGSGTGGVTFEYFYVDLDSASDPDETNEVVRLVIEDIIDESDSAYARRIYGLNRGGRILREAFIEDPVGTGTKYWCQSWTIDTTYPEMHLVAEERSAKAHDTIDSDSDLEKFLDPFDPFDGMSPWSNDQDTLNNSSGVILVHAYDSDGNRTETKIKEGENGTANYLAAWEYNAGSSDFKKHLLTKQYEYPSKTTTKTSGEATSYTYTFGTGDELQQIKQTLPTISSGQNGSGTATEILEYYDSDELLRWLKDGEGVVTEVDPENWTGQ